MTDTETAALGLFAAAVAATVVGLLVLRAVRRAVGPHGAGPLPVSDRNRDLVLRLLAAETRDGAAEELEAAGAEAVPDLLAVLSGERAAWDDASVLAAHARAIWILGRIGDPRARPVLESHVIRETHLAADAARALALAGWDESLPLLESALGGTSAGPEDVVVDAVRSDGDVSRAGQALRAAVRGDPPEVRSAVVDGIRRAAGLGRAGPEHRRRLAPLLAALVGSRCGAADALLALDPAAAPIVLQSESILRDRRDLGVLEDVFGALVEARAAVDGRIVIECLSLFPAGVPVAEAQAGALRALASALGASGHPESRALLERMRGSPDRFVRRAALGGLLVSEGLWHCDPDGGDLDVEFAGEPSAEPAGARRTAWYAKRLLDCPGLGAFLGTPAGRSPGDVAAALRTLGVPEAATVVEEAAARLGGGVPADDEERLRRIDAASADAYPFFDLDERLLDCSDDLRSSLEAWIVDHADEFRRPAA